MLLSDATDGVLLAKYAYEGNAQAFVELAHRYGGFVYGVCLRITHSSHEAEDLAQACFRRLAKNSASIQVSLPRWLHTLAKSRAKSALRDRATRQYHEQIAESKDGSSAEATWDDVGPRIDRLLQELPEDLRDPVISHFFLGRTHERVARALGIDQLTVSERIEKGVTELQEKLRKTGVAASPAALSVLLETNGPGTAPPTLVAALDKMASMGIAPDTTMYAGAAIRETRWLAAAQGKVAVIMLLTAALAGGLLAHLTRPRVDADIGRSALEKSTVDIDAAAQDTDWDFDEPEIAITVVPGVKMNVHKTGFGTGILWSSHLHLDHRQVTRWYDSPGRRLESVTLSAVTRMVQILGRACFEVQIDERDRDGETKTSLEYFWVSDDGTHWIRPRGEGAPDLTDDSAWELQDEGEGIESHEISSEAPPENSKLEVVDLTIGEKTTRCLRETFFELDPGYDGAGGDAFYRADGTCVYYRRLLMDGAKKYDALTGAPEYLLADRAFRVWYSVVLVDESR